MTARPTSTKAPASKPGAKMGFASASAAAVFVLWAALIGSEKRVYEAYLDVFGVATVCAGITGPAVKFGKVYTDAECDVLESEYIERMNARLGKCVPREDLELHQVIAWGHFAYNVGSTAFCGSTAARRLNERRDGLACEQIMRWTFGRSRKTGALIDCSFADNKCMGLYTRRVRERAMCLGDLDAFKPSWQVPR